MDLSNSSFNPLLDVNNNVVLNVCIFAEILEFLFYLPSIPITLFASILVYNTSIMHQNLKFLLMAQFGYVFLYMCFRLFELGAQFFVYKNIFLYSTSVMAATLFLIQFGDLIGHWILLERILATIFIENYESWKCYKFPAITLLITIILSMGIIYYQMFVFEALAVISNIVTIVHMVNAIASLVEIFIIILLTQLNVRMFSSPRTEIVQKLKNNWQKLSVRYQLAENIRTGRQLAPNFLCHFVHVLVSFCLIMNLRFNLFTDLGCLALFLQLAYLIHSVNNLMMPFTVILFHPILNRSAKQELRKFRNFLNCFRRSGTISPSSMELPLPMETILAKQLLQQNANGETEAYFRQLLASWGDYR